MKNSYLITVLQALNKKEIRELKKWINSPIHNQREDVKDLFLYLISSKHLEDDKYLQKDRVFRKVFPKQSFDDAKLRQTIHFLTKTIEEFLVFDDWKNNEVRFQITLARIYRKRNLEKAFLKTIKSSEVKLNKASIQNNEFFENEYSLQYEKYSFGTGRIKPQATFNYQEISDSLDIMYIVNKLKLLCLSDSQRAVIKTNEQFSFEEEVIQHIEKNEMYLIPAVALYYYIYKANRYPSEKEYYEKLKHHIHASGHFFPDGELNEIILLALNYCIARMNAGEIYFRREAFEYQQMGIQKNIFLENDLIDPSTYLNIVIIGSLLQEYDRVEPFIENYKKHLPKADKEKMSHYALAILFFIKGDYERCRDLLIHFDYDDILLNTQAKSMLIRLYYEQDEIDLLEALLESTRNYLARKKVMGYRREQFMKLIRYTKKLINLNPYDKNTKEKLKKEVVQAKPFPEKRWVLKQIEAF